MDFDSRDYVALGAFNVFCLCGSREIHYLSVGVDDDEDVRVFDAFVRRRLDYDERFNYRLAIYSDGEEVDLCLVDHILFRRGPLVDQRVDYRLFIDLRYCPDDFTAVCVSQEDRVLPLLVRSRVRAILGEDAAIMGNFATFVAREGVDFLLIVSDCGACFVFSRVLGDCGIILAFHADDYEGRDYDDVVGPVEAVDDDFQVVVRYEFGLSCRTVF